MKKFCKTVCLFITIVSCLLLCSGCGERGPGLYAWYGGRIDVDSVLRITVDAGDGAKVYDVPFDTYRTVFIYLKGITPDTGVDENGDQKIATKEEKNAAIKEVAEDILMEYYSLVALGEKYGISITEEDRQAFYDDYQSKIQTYIDQIDESEIDFDGTREEYAEELYRKSLEIVGMTPEYFEFIHYKSLLEQKLKLFFASDLEDYLTQSYYHYKQVVVRYTKGDSAAEDQARAAIERAYEELLSGRDIDEVIADYSNDDYTAEVYIDSYGSIVGSSTGDSVGSVTANAVKALEIGEISDTISGDESDYTGYFAVFQRLGFDLEYICSSDAIAEDIYCYPYVGAEYTTPHYSSYLTVAESYLQNTSCVPIDQKIYDRIAVNTLY